MTYDLWLMAGDVVWLPDVDDGRCHVSIAKAYGWWRWAARWATARGSAHDVSNGSALGVAHIVRVDDDTFLNLPNLETDFNRWVSQ